MVKCGSLGVYLHELNFCRYTSWFEHFHLSSLFLFFNYNLPFSLPYLFFLVIITLWVYFVSILGLLLDDMCLSTF